MIAIVALLIGILLPSLGSARRAAMATKCLSQVRSLEMAHAMYADAHQEAFVDAGLAHGGVTSAKAIRRSWPFTLQEYYGGPIILRSPGDNSPFWPISMGGSRQGATLAQIKDQMDSGLVPDLTRLGRWTSYGLNNYTLRSFGPGLEPDREPFDRMSKIQTPSATVHFLQMTEGHDGSDFALSDHVHAESWSDAGPEYASSVAGSEIELHAHGGAAKSFDGMASYGFLDGHARTLKFRDVYKDYDNNRFHPDRAH